MSLLERDAPIADGDEAPITSLTAAFAKQKRAFLADSYPSYDERLGHLRTLAGMMMGNRERVARALAADFGAHPTPASDLIEVLGVVARALRDGTSSGLDGRRRA